MGRYGVTVTTAVAMPDPTTDPDSFHSASRTAVAKLKSDGVNAVITSLGGLVNAGIVSKEATNQTYFPEWITSGILVEGCNTCVRLGWDSVQAAHLYGLRAVQLRVPKENGDGFNLYKWEDDVYPQAQVYGEFAQLSSIRPLVAGIMTAGPRLT